MKMPWCWAVFLFIFALADGRSRKSQRGFSKKRPSSVPAKPTFIHAKELAVDDFAEHVLAVNRTNEQVPTLDYHPFVLFHVSWCQHCKQAMHEFEKAAASVDRASKTGKLDNLKVLPRFFLLQCDMSLEANRLCESYAGSSLPVLKLFRYRRDIVYTHPRVADTLVPWLFQVSREAVTRVSTKEDVEALSRGHAVSILKVDPANEKTWSQIWTQVAFDLIEETTLAITAVGSDVGRRLMTSPSITVWGRDVEPLVLNHSMTRHFLTKWVSFNQFHFIVDLTPWSAPTLQKSGHMFVTLVCATSPGSDHLKAQFREKAKSFRSERKWLFAAVNASEKASERFLQYQAPLMSPSRTLLPRIFVFQGKNVYWEDPSLRVPSDITSETLEALVANDEAWQDRSVRAVVKEKRKLFVRFASGSAFGGMVVLSTTLLLVSCCFCCVRSLLDDDERLGGGPDDKDD
mmetsp:Transcript_8286/g.23007  ORF Transcript_8286/g.23007 Transcript_8286/m.23007 type:complete len:459 (-) Transcript_8286:70-1446(-)